MRLRSLSTYVIGTVLVWSVILGVVRLHAPSRFHGALSLAAMFYVGMLAMYIAQHVYPFHPWRR